MTNLVLLAADEALPPELLSYTDLPLAKVAARTGYNGYPNLYTVFRKATGQNPTDCRNQVKS